METLKFDVGGMTCGGCGARVQHVLGRLQGDARSVRTKGLVMKAMRLRHLGAMAQAGVLVWATWALPANATGAKVYVADEDAGTVSVLDVASMKKIGSIAVGQGPHNVQVSPDGKLVWVTNNGEPVKTADSKANQHMAKSGHQGMAAIGEVWAIDTATDAVVAKIPVGAHPAHVVVSSDSRFAYITNGVANTVSVVDTAARIVIATIPVGASPHGIRISPDGRQAYVANLKGGSVSVIDMTNHQEVAQIPVGKGPVQVGFTPDDRFAFVSLSGENAVAVIDPRTRKVIRKVAVGPVPIQLVATPDSRLLLVANQGSRKTPGKTVSMIDLENFNVTKTVETGLGAHGVVIDRDGRYAYVTNSYAGTVSVVDIKNQNVVATVPVGKGPNGVSMTP